MNSCDRRTLLVGSFAMPLVAAGLSLRRGEVGGTGARALLLFDPELSAGRRFASAAGERGAMPVALAGDRVRQLAALLPHAPAVIYGVTRHADALLVEDIAAEAGFRRQAQLCCDALGGQRGGHDIYASRTAAFVHAAGPAWPIAFAALALGSAGQLPALGPASNAAGLGWILARRR